MVIACMPLRLLTMPYENMRSLYYSSSLQGYFNSLCKLPYMLSEQYVNYLKLVCAGNAVFAFPNHIISCLAGVCKF